MDMEVADLILGVAALRGVAVQVQAVVLMVGFGSVLGLFSIREAGLLTPTPDNAHGFRLMIIGINTMKGLLCRLFPRQANLQLIKRWRR